MDFKEKQSIYLQIGDYICENILRDIWKKGDRIPSTREFAAQIEVNPNTVVRTYSYLEELGVISKERGVGYFVADDSVKNIMKFKKQEFLSSTMPEFFKNFELLGITWDEIDGHYKEYLNKGKGEITNENKQ